MMKSIQEKARYGLPFADELVIDSHCHFGSYHPTAIPYGTPGEIVKNMGRLGVDKACVCTSSAGSFGSEMAHNRYVADAVEAFPKQLLGYATLNMNYRESLLEDYLACEAMGLVVGVKMHIYRQDEYGMADDFLHPLYERLNRKHGLILHHDFGPVGPLEDVVKAYPNITFIAGHLGRRTSRYVPLLKRYPNFYNCTCATLRYDEVAEFVNKIGSEKLLYGSDLIVLDSTFGFGPVVYAKISDSEKRNILGLNMDKILRQVTTEG